MVSQKHAPTSFTPPGVNGVSHTNGISTVHLHVVVVGAGVGGLSMALRLQLIGHHVTVIDRFSEAEILDSDSGGIHIPPNMTRLLKREPQDGTECSGLHLMEGKTAETIGIMEFPAEMIEDLGSKFYMTQRVVFLRQCYEQCLQHGVRFIFGTAVTSIDTSNQEHVSVNFGRGQTECADLVIGADGANSLLRSAVVEAEDDEEVVAMLSGVSVATPIQKLRDDPDLAPLCDSTKVEIWMNNDTSITGGVHGQYYDISFLSTRYHHGMHDVKRRRQFTVEDFRTFKIDEYEPRIRKLVELGSSCYFTTQPLYALSQVVDDTHRVLLIGDAARAPPMHGTHNSSNAVEDACTFSAILSHMTDRKQLPRLLQAYEELRGPRTTETQREQLSGQSVVSLPDGPAKEARNQQFGFMLQMTLAGQPLTDDMLAACWADHLKQFNYDPVEAVTDWWLNWGRYMKELNQVTQS